MAAIDLDQKSKQALRSCGENNYGEGTSREKAQKATKEYSQRGNKDYNIVIPAKLALTCFGGGNPNCLAKVLFGRVGRAHRFPMPM